MPRRSPSIRRDISYAGAIIYHGEEDERMLKALGVVFTAQRRDQANGSTMRGCTMSEQVFSKLNKYWGRFFWSLNKVK